MEGVSRISARHESVCNGGWGQERLQLKCKWCQHHFALLSGLVSRRATVNPDTSIHTRAPQYHPSGRLVGS